MILIQSLTSMIPDGFADTLSRTMAKQALRAIADQARDFWIQLAQEELRGTQLDYINGIQRVAKVQGKPLSLEISLVGQLPAVIENDQPQTDLHDTLLGPKVPVVERGSGQKGKWAKKGGGYYRAIPFNHQGPDTAGVSGTPIGRPYIAHPDVPNVQEMAQAIYKAAKKLKPTQGMPGGKITYGGRLPAGMAPKLREHHKTDIYAGMVRNSKTYAKATQSKLVTFRMISTGSPGWIRKATQGKHYCLKVAQEVRRRIAPETFAYMLKGRT